MSSEATVPLKGVAARVGSWSARHTKSVLAGWLVFVVLSVVFGSMIGTKQLTEADQFNGESGRAEKVLEKSFPAPATEQVLIHSSTLTADQPAFRAAVADIRDGVAATGVATHIRAATDRNAGGLVSKDRHSALVDFQLRGEKDTASSRIAPVEAAVRAVQRAHPELRIEEFGDASVGAQMDKWVENDLHRAETLSLPVTLAILVIAFGALVAAGVPVLLAISGVFATIGLVAIPSHIFPVDQNASIVIMLIGMAVGVDYSLFYLRRERKERDRGHDDRAALAIASATSGRAILVSGLTVIVAMAGQFLTGDKGSMSFAVGTIMVVLVAMLGSLTALPATLALLGRHVEKGRVRIPFVRRNRAARRESRMWGFVLNRVVRHPVAASGAALAVLLALASPALHFKVHQTGISDLPPNMPGYTVLQHMQQAFPSDAAPAEVVIQARDVTAPEVRGAIDRLERDALATGQIGRPFDLTMNHDRTVAVLEMTLAGDGTDRKSGEALSTLRERLIPRTLGAVGGVTVNVTGETAINHDSSSMLSRNTPLVFAFVLTLAFLLLLVTFRSIVIPIKAIVLNLLSVGAGYGVLVAVFQDGHGSSLLGFTKTGGVAPWLPLFLFVILFGLSMDYHVFILSRIKELVDGGMSTEDAVSEGIKSTAGVVTSAAAVMVAVFSIFATLSLIDLKEFGVGLATAVLIDATIIRAILLPASMRLLGDWNWYLPRPLRWLPQFRHESAPRPAMEVAGD
ncbi:MAG TPA: MMPL family transporter [Gaiellales bacterium]|nr:MMPL family transporter [Gaiellales bacterium]